MLKMQVVLRLPGFTALLLGQTQGILVVQPHWHVQHGETGFSILGFPMHAWGVILCRLVLLTVAPG